MCLGIGVGFITTLLIREPKVIDNEEARLIEQKAHDYLHNHPKLNEKFADILSWIYGAVVCPFINFTSRNHLWIAMLLLVLTFKSSDNMIGTMGNLFFADLGFSKEDIASASAVFGLSTTIIGGLIGGIMVIRLGFLNCLLGFSLIHGASHLFNIALLNHTDSIWFLYLTVAVQHLTSGMATTALLAYQMTLCTPHYAATQLALLTSLYFTGRTALAPLSGYLADNLPWDNFFYISVAVTIIPVIIIMYIIKKQRMVVQQPV